MDSQELTAGLDSGQIFLGQFLGAREWLRNPDGTDKLIRIGTGLRFNARGLGSIETLYLPTDGSEAKLLEKDMFYYVDEKILDPDYYHLCIYSLTLETKVQLIFNLRFVAKLHTRQVPPLL